MALLDKFRRLAGEREELLAGGSDPFRVTFDRVLSPTEALLDGRRVLLLGTNNYLGLTFDPECVAAAAGAARSEGTGTTGSRMANGSYAGHAALERELADFLGRRHALVFSTGYAANAGVIGSLVGPGDAVLIDADSHASIYDGARASGAEVVRFRHDDAADLDKRLRRLGERARDALVVVEGLYSMRGDAADLAAIAEAKARHGALLLVDEAHSLGVLGAEGRGRAEEAGCERGVDFVAGTFSKSLGATGGFCASDHPELELLRYACRAYVFTASPCPSVVASVRAALAAIRARPELRERLRRNARLLRELLGLAGGGPADGPIVPLVLGDPRAAVAAWRELLARGVYVNLVLPPGAPDGSSLLRLSVSAAHDEDQVRSAADALAAVLGDRLSSRA